MDKISENDFEKIESLIKDSPLEDECDRGIKYFKKQIDFILRFKGNTFDLKLKELEHLRMKEDAILRGQDPNSISV